MIILCLLLTTGFVLFLQQIWSISHPVMPLMTLCADVNLAMDAQTSPAHSACRYQTPLLHPLQVRCTRMLKMRKILLTLCTLQTHFTQVEYLCFRGGTSGTWESAAILHSKVNIWSRKLFFQCNTDVWIIQTLNIETGKFTFWIYCSNNFYI